MKKKRKSRAQFRPGAPIKSLDELLARLDRGEGVYLWDTTRPLHHGWVRSLQFDVVARMVSAGNVRRAERIPLPPVALLEYKPLGPTDNPYLEVLQSRWPAIARVPSTVSEYMPELASPLSEFLRAIFDDSPLGGALLPARLAGSEARYDFVEQYGYAIPTEAALQSILKWSQGRVVEIGAGGGYWSALLAARGATVAAYDNYSWSGLKIGQHFDVLRGTWRMAAAYPDRALFLCWPPSGTGMAWSAARAFASAGGKVIAYVGEYGGCTGDERFHEWLDNCTRQVEVVRLPVWFGLHDRLHIHIVNPGGLANPAAANREEAANATPVSPDAQREVPLPVLSEAGGDAGHG